MEGLFCNIPLIASNSLSTTEDSGKVNSFEISYFKCFRMVVVHFFKML